MLEHFGFTADTVANGTEAVEALSRIAYDLVLMDCQMPEMDGFQATVQIRKREGSNRHTIIIAVTADAMQGTKEKCIEAGMDDYISKPIAETQLESILTKYVKVICNKPSKN